MRGSPTARLVAVGVLALALLVGVAVLVVRGGGDDVALPARLAVPDARIDVDTPALRRAKQAAGIADCRPGAARNELPAVTLPCFGGGPAVRLDRLAGPLVVNLWGSWCGPCKRELPDYQRLSEALAGRVTVVGLNTLDPQTQNAMTMLAEAGVTYPQLSDPQDLLRSVPPRLVTLGLPVLVLVDDQGAIAYRGGFVRDYDQLAGLVEQHLGIAA